MVPIIIAVISIILTLLFAASVVILFRLPEPGEYKPPKIPGALPFLGNVLGFDRKCPHLVLSDWAKKYGDIYRLSLLGEDIVVVSGADLIYQALVSNSQDFAGRPSIFRVRYGFHYNRDVIFGTHSDWWVIMKRQLSRAMKDYGTGERVVNGIVAEEMTSLMTSLHDHVGKNFCPSMVTLTAVVNSITAAVSIIIGTLNIK